MRCLLHSDLKFLPTIEIGSLRPVWNGYWRKPFLNPGDRRIERMHIHQKSPSVERLVSSPNRGVRRHDLSRVFESPQSGSEKDCAEVSGNPEGSGMVIEPCRSKVSQILIR